MTTSHSHELFHMLYKHKAVKWVIFKKFVREPPKLPRVPLKSSEDSLTQLGSDQTHSLNVFLISHYTLFSGSHDCCACSQSALWASFTGAEIELKDLHLTVGSALWSSKQQQNLWRTSLHGDFTTTSRSLVCGKSSFWYKTMLLFFVFCTAF